MEGLSWLVMLHTLCHLVSLLMHTLCPRIQKNTTLIIKNIDRGQGLNHAIQDAYNLVNILINHHKSSSVTPDLASQLQSYAQEVSVRGAEEVRLSKQNAYMVLDWKVLEQSPVFKHALDRSPAVDAAKHADSEVSEEKREARQDITVMAGA